MLASSGGPTLMELDRQASIDNQPYILTSFDCSEPKELDDGVTVEPLPSAQEMYRVGVCVVDASSLYKDSQILGEAMRRTEAKYWQLPGGEKGYDPMVPEDAIRDLDFRIRKPGDIRSAMIVRFVVGESQPPTDAEVVFGQVELVANHDYRELAELSHAGGQYERFARAAKFIKDNLGFTSGGDYDQPEDAKKVATDPVQRAFTEGSRMNEAFMVGAYHQVGRLLIPDPDRIGIYRVHDTRDEGRRMFLPANVATYSWEPGTHEGLNLYGVCRVTSPLRRLEDLIMNYLLRQRYDGNPVTRDDEDIVALAVHKLNARIMGTYASKPMKHAKGRALQGRERRLLGNRSLTDTNVVFMRPEDIEPLSA